MAQIKEIAEIKLPDLNTNKIESAMNTIIILTNGASFP